MDRRVYEEFLERQKRATVINSLGGAFTLGTSLILCYRSPWGTTYIPQARDKLSIRLLLIVCVILDITEPKEKQHTHQNPCIYNHLLFSCSVMSDSLQPHGLQHTRLLCPSPSPGVCSNSCPLNQLPSNHLILCCPLLLLPSVFPSVRDFSNEVALHITWPGYWSFSFSISTSSE